MEEIRYRTPVSLQAKTGVTETQLVSLVGQLVAACDHYAALSAQECLLRTDQQQELAQLQEQLETNRQELQQLRTQVQQEQLSDSVQEDSAPSDSETLGTLAEQIFRLVRVGDEMAEALERKERQCIRQKAQIDYLNAQNLRYQRLYQRITQTWYGKILLHIYHLFQKLGWI